MKKIISLVLVFIGLVVGVFFAVGQVDESAQAEEAYLRVHIRANSNLEVDQEVKYAVKTAVVDFLTPKIASGTTFEKAYEILEQNLEGLESVANQVLEENGFSYTAKAKLTNEYFPTRSYGDCTLENGYYDALILELGEAEGNNWWCVVYPPLCFIGAEGSNVKNIKYKSKLVEIINKFFAND